MKIFNNPGKFAKHLVALIASEKIAVTKGLDKAATIVEKEAKKEIGTYQPEVGPFQDWAELADSTKEDRLKKGYTENDPLLRSGDLRNSISHQTKELTAQIGSTSDIMIYQEFGTTFIPPRPVLGPAAFKNKEKIKKILGSAAVTGLIDGEKIHESLEYDFKVDNKDIP